MKDDAQLAKAKRAAMEAIKGCDSFLLVSVNTDGKNNAVIAAITNNANDETIGEGVLKFIEARDDAANGANNKTLH